MSLKHQKCIGMLFRKAQIWNAKLEKLSRWFEAKSKKNIESIDQNVLNQKKYKSSTVNHLVTFSVMSLMWPTFPNSKYGVQNLFAPRLGNLNGLLWDHTVHIHDMRTLRKSRLFQVSKWQTKKKKKRKSDCKSLVTKIDGEWRRKFVRRISDDANCMLNLSIVRFHTIASQPQH